MCKRETFKQLAGEQCKVICGAWASKHTYITVIYYSQSFVGLWTHNGVWKCLVISSKIILKDKRSLLASLVLLKTFNILGSFPFHKKVFYSGKKYFNKNGNKNVSSMTSLWKPLLGTFIFKSVAHFVIFIRASHTWCARSTINISSVS